MAAKISIQLKAPTMSATVGCRGKYAGTTMPTPIPPNAKGTIATVDIHVK